MQALGIAFVTVAIVLTAAMSQRAMLTPQLGVLSIGAVVPSIIGMVIGQKLRRVLTEDQFTRVVLVVIMIAGFYMVARGAFGV